jgi:uncharacterized protein
MNLTLCLTHDCNLACTYCYAGANRHEAMSETVADKAIEFALERTKDKLQIGFFGGEPLMEWELLQQCTERAEALTKQAGIRLTKTVTTNATLLTEERATWLARHDFFLAVSIDGNRSMHDAARPLCSGASSFEAAFRGLQAALKHGSKPDVIVVIDPANIAFLTGSVRFLADEAQASRISINPNFYTEWPESAIEQWRTAFNELGDFYTERFRANRPFELNFINSKIITRLKDGYSACDRCSFGEKEIAVAPSGNIYPCERLVSDDRNAEVCIGSVFSGFDDRKYFELLNQRGNTNTECMACSIRERCMNWCGCINYATTGSIHQVAGIVCFHEKTAVETADRVGSTLYAESNPAFLKQFYYV